jgi:ABC-type multidrug transport system fused ATPase/permease subunit
MKNPYFSLIGRVWNYGAEWRWQICGYYLAYILAQGSLSLSPYAFGRAIDVLQHFQPDRFNEVIFWLGLGVLVVLLFWIFHGPARLVERSVALKIQQTFRNNLYEQLTHLPLKWHQDHHSGNIITRLNRSSAALYRFAENQYVYIETIVRFLTSIGFLFWISFPVGLISLFFSLVIIVPMVLFDRVLIPLYDAENEVENRVGSVLFDYISNMTTVLTLRLGELTRSNLWQRMLSIWPAFRKESRLNETKWFLMMMLLSLIQAIVLIGYIGYSLQVSGTILIGLVVMIFRYQWELSGVFQELSMHLGEIVRMDTDVKGIQPILDDIQKFAHLPQGLSLASQWHTIEVENLVFHHEPTTGRGQMFDRLAFQIRRGEKLALIGHSGGGKSTLLNLLCGLYTPSSVNLKMDGVSFNTFEPLQAIATLIPQEPEIFENTISFNITLDLPADEKEIQQVINLAGFSSVLKKLPQGLKTDIREKGLNLSVGQKQRLALARGLFAARYSSLILMDEPTSSVDLPTEKEILSGVIDAFPNSALIISLHRLHLLPHFDRVLMLEHGKVVAAGSVQELLNTPGPVLDLWKSYIDDGG